MDMIIFVFAPIHVNTCYETREAYILTGTFLLRLLLRTHFRGENGPAPSRSVGVFQLEGDKYYKGSATWTLFLFTYELSILKDHKLVTTGLYKLVRHPSYLGAFGCFTVCLCHGS